MKRLFFYTYGAFGLGHLRRVLHIAERMSDLDDSTSILIATNSSQSRAVTLPKNCSFLPLPPLIRDIFDDEPNKYRSLTPGLSVAEAFVQRSQIIRNVLDSFSPQLVFADHGATGAERELVPLLEGIESTARSARARLVLGLRDIYGSIDWTQKDWDRLGALEVLRLYDLILVFGDSTILTTAQELKLEAQLPGKVHHTGYVGRPVHLQQRDGEVASDRPPVLVTAGGGYDGRPLLESFAEFLEGASGHMPFRFQVITGPFLSRRLRREFKRRCMAVDPSIEVIASTKWMEKRLASVAGVISMGGYNSMVEIISGNKPGLIMPRGSPSEEQVLRARRLCPQVGLSYCLPGQRTLPAISGFIERLAAGRGSLRTGAADLCGATKTVELINSVPLTNAEA